MVYVVGILGFVGGFLVGMYILSLVLKDVPTEKLLNDRMLRVKYGIINWVCAAIGAASFIYLYRMYF